MFYIDAKSCLLLHNSKVDNSTIRNKVKKLLRVVLSTLVKQWAGITIPIQVQPVTGSVSIANPTVTTLVHVLMTDPGY